jgi:hypothetical protein
MSHEMTHYTEYKHWNIIHDKHMCRISGFDENAREHYLVIDMGPGWIQRRRKALERIQDHIESGNEAGFVE